MVRFSKLSPDEHGNPVETEVRDIEQSDMLACPHVIIVPEHYRPNGSCMCNDPNHKVMIEWGYVWDENTMQWEAPADE
jgi:hypothetical protein